MEVDVMGKKKCDAPMEVWTRVVGFYRPTNGFNKGKKEEFSMRKTFNLNKIETAREIEKIIERAESVERLQAQVNQILEEENNGTQE